MNTLKLCELIGKWSEKQERHTDLFIQIREEQKEMQNIEREMANLSKKIIREGKEYFKQYE